MEAKGTSGDFRYFKPELNDRIRERALIEAELGTALERKQFELSYQPMIDPLERGICAEALLRWNSRLGLVGPDRFIPVAEETGIILEIGEWVLDEACAQLARWRQDGLCVPRIAINASVRQFREPGYAASVLATISRHGLEPSDIEIEITESLFAGNDERVIQEIEALRSGGIRMAIDDFGTGFSCFGALGELPVGVLKIDRSFVSGMETRRGGISMIGGMIEMAHAMNLKVVGEGVETEEQARILEDRGCDVFQGFYFSRPLAARDFGAFASVRERKMLAA